MSQIWEMLRTIFYALAFALCIRFAVAQPFRIPTGSMQPTLEVGDYILVSKWSYGYSRYSFAPFERLFPGGRFLALQPQRGDVIVFRPPPSPETDFVKRLIGLPGDRIRVTNGALYINGQPVQRESLGMQPFTGADGLTTEIPTYRETLPNGVSYRTFDRQPFGANDNTREFVVPAGHYFFMGDDRDISEDSRTEVVGNVPFENLVGPAQMVIVSFDGTTAIVQPWTLITGFRGNRFLHGLRQSR